MSQVRVLFVCLGNICRSPMAQGVFEHLLGENGLSAHFLCDSAGTSAAHVGENPDPRTLLTLQGKSIPLQHKARQFKAADFDRFDFILAMDRSNQRDILSLQPHATGARILLMRDFDPKPASPDVPDPYWSGQDGFEEVYEILRRSCSKFLEEIRRNALS